jgi:lysosomal acid lipase/cholesteryl ester hydrolase
MLRSAVLLSPIAYLNQMPSPLARGAADLFLAEVKPNEWICLIQKNEFPNLNLKEKNSLTFLLSILSPYCTGLVLVRTP